MSKIGKLPIMLQPEVKTEINQGMVKISGPKGELNYILPAGIVARVMDGKLLVSQQGQDQIKTKALFGLARALLNNMVKGVTTGFEKKLELSGVGYRAQVQGNDLVLSLGFSHPVKFLGTADIKFAVVDNVISIKGIDTALVGDMAARIRAVRPPEPYKGKGIKYVGEKIRRKAGKAAKAVGTK